MLVQIDTRSSVPIYQQLKTALIAGILSGELKEGDRLPSVRNLASDLGINLHTVRKVYGLMTDDGYIDMTRNQGALVKVPPELDREGFDQFAKVLLPIAIELRARNITKEQYNTLMDELWEDSLRKVRDDE
jgi:DNA-binding transcriptional regulator YhcF (GntR family)